MGANIGTQIASAKAWYDKYHCFPLPSSRKYIMRYLIPTHMLKECGDEILEKMLDIPKKRWVIAGYSSEEECIFFAREVFGVEINSEDLAGLELYCIEEVNDEDIQKEIDSLKTWYCYALFTLRDIHYPMLVRNVGWHEEGWGKLIRADKYCESRCPSYDYTVAKHKELVAKQK